MPKGGKMSLERVSSSSHPIRSRAFVLVFFLGIFVGYLARGSKARASLKRKTASPFHISSVPFVGVSHNPEIKKQVLASYFQLPHVTQVAKAYIGVGQVASENWHKDMAEMFYFVKGSGIISLDGVNHTVTEGSLSVVIPPTKHTIYNTGHNESLDVIVIASVP